MMAEHDTLRIHARLAGVGNVYHEERLVAKVEYLLKDVQEVLAPSSRAAGGSSDGVGQRTIYGLFRSPQAALLGRYIGTRLALQLEGGPLLSFTVTKLLGDRACLIQGLATLPDQHDPVTE